MHYHLFHMTHQGLHVYMLLIYFPNSFNECQLCARPLVGWQMEWRVGACFSLAFIYLLLRELRRIKGKEAFVLCSEAMRWEL